MKKFLALCTLVCIGDSANAMQIQNLNKFRHGVGINHHKQTFLTYTINTPLIVPQTSSLIEEVDYTYNYKQSPATINSTNKEGPEKYKLMVRTVLEGMAPVCKLSSWEKIFDEDFPIVAHNLDGAIDQAMIRDKKINFVSIPLELASFSSFSHNEKTSRQWYNDFKKISGTFLKAKDKGIGIILSAGNDKIDIDTAYPGMAELLKSMEGYLFLVYGLQTSSTVFSPNVWYVPQRTNYCQKSDCIQNGVCAPVHLGILADESDYKHFGNYGAVAHVTAATLLINDLRPDLKANKIFSILNASSSQEEMGLGSYKAPRSPVPSLKCLPGMINFPEALKLAKAKSKKKIENRS